MEVNARLGGVCEYETKLVKVSASSTKIPFIPNQLSELRSDKDIAHKCSASVGQCLMV